MRERVRGRGTKQPANIAVIEGNRGLYDSIDPKGAYSTARLAKLLKAPVIIVVDCSKVTTTLSAMILGCQKLDPEVSIKGVVLNNVANPRQESVIRRAIKRNCGLPVVGAFPVLKKDLFPERHMGLTPSQEHREVEKALSTIIEMGEKYLDLKAIWKIAKSAPPLEDSNELRGTSCEPQNSKLKTQNLKLDSPLKVGVIIDSAFQFYYPENLEELKRGGAELITINALKDKRLPKIDALYIGGGFPETHAKELAQNRSLRKDLHEAVERGLSVYAECGGLMYLGESLILNNKTYPMVGALPLVFAVEKKPQAHGYTIVKVERENSYFRKGAVLKGHEFHYSHVISSTNPRSPIPNPRLFNPQPLMPNPPIRFAFKMKRGKGIMDGMDGICYKNVLATYTHLHAHGVKEWAKGIIRCARKFSVVARQS
ncbi:MAG: hydrogenobyrinic acid a,c-diamide synthase (glutamine-hydrolyzing) [Nitrospirae bacterium]|nr:hydrogenobyrinic acid a,c-diamide synthase (glutamine-hydrolyzing) [Nitrospirota bacterium]